MFGSKQLLIAFLLGLFGLFATTGALASKHDPLEVVFILGGLGMVWISALFGPLMVMQERERKVGQQRPLDHSVGE